MTIQLRPGERTSQGRLPWNPLYLTGCVSIGPAGDSIRAAAAQQPRLGFLAQPGNTVHTQVPHFANWAIDNGAFGVAFQCFKGKRGPWNDDDTAKYLRYLRRVRDEVDITGCLFATAPDVLSFHQVEGRAVPVGDAEATWERSRHIFSEIRALGFPAALVAQDGILDEHPTTSFSKWDRFDVLFLGGSDQFKMQGEAKQITHIAQQYHRKWVHMGRVSSLKRMRYLASIGCNSADGTYLGFGPEKNLPNVLAWLHATSPRGCSLQHRRIDRPGQSWACECGKVMAGGSWVTPLPEVMAA